MKKLLLITLVAALSSCSTAKYAMTVGANVLDYSKYSESGFFITESNALSKEYTPVASIMFEYRSGYEVLKPEEKITDKRGYVYTTKAAVYGSYKKVSQEDAIDAMVVMAKEIGANGIINLKLTVLGSSIGRNDSGFSVSGMAIKIE